MARATDLQLHWQRVGVGLVIILPAVLLVTYYPLRGEGVDALYWSLVAGAAMAGIVYGYLSLSPDVLNASQSSAAVVAVAIPMAAVIPVVLGISIVGLVTGPVFVFLDVALVAASFRVLASRRRNGHA